MWPWLCRRERLHHRADVSGQRGGNRLVAVELGRLDVDLDELGVGAPLRRFAVAEQPVQPGADEQHHVGPRKASERAAATDCGWSSGSSPLAIDIGRNGSRWFRRTAESARPPAHTPRPCRGRSAAAGRLASTAGARSTASGAGSCRGAGSTTRHSVAAAFFGVDGLAEHRGRDVEVHAAGAARHRGADRAGDAAADVLGPVDPVGRLRERSCRRSAGRALRSLRA